MKILHVCSLVFFASVVTHTAGAQSGAWEYRLIGTDVAQPSIAAPLDASAGGDGWDDLLAGSSHNHSVGVYGWDPSGNDFGNNNAVIYLTGNEIYQPRRVVTTDIDADGAQDFVVLSNGRDQLGWYDPGAPSPWSVLVSEFGAGAICAPMDLDVADLDSDSDLDIVVIDGHGSGCASNLDLYRNGGGGASFTRENLVSLPTNVRAFSDVVAADLDGDGDSDLLTAGGRMSSGLIGFDREVTWFENDGGGTFSLREDLMVSNNIFHKVDALDLDSDGDLDVVAHMGGEMHCAENLGGGQFLWLNAIFVNDPDDPSSSFEEWSAGDMDADGDLDIVAVVTTAPGSSVDYELWWWENLGGLQFAPRQFVDGVNPSLSGVEELSLHDFNQDGLPDIVAAINQNGFFGPGTVVWWVNRLCEVDCNANGVDDCAELSSGASPDCNGNNAPDSCDIASGFDSDVNSNGIPDSCECTAQSHCPTSPNTVGAGVEISVSGVSSVSNATMGFDAEGGPGNQPGLFFYGSGTANAPFGEGVRCVSTPVYRMPPPVFFDGAGEASHSINFSTNPVGSGPGQIQPGSTWYFQLWYRDPTGGPFGWNLSNGLEVTFCP